MVPSLHFSNGSPSLANKFSAPVDFPSSVTPMALTIPSIWGSRRTQHLNSDDIDWISALRGIVWFVQSLIPNILNFIDNRLRADSLFPVLHKKKVWSRFRLSWRRLWLTQTQINDAQYPTLKQIWGIGALDALGRIVHNENECRPLSLRFENCHIFFKGCPKTLSICMCWLLSTTKLEIIFGKRTGTQKVLKRKVRNDPPEQAPPAYKNR